MKIPTSMKQFMAIVVILSCSGESATSELVPADLQQKLGANGFADLTKTLENMTIKQKRSYISQIISGFELEAKQRTPKPPRHSRKKSEPPQLEFRHDVPDSVRELARIHIEKSQSPREAVWTCPEHLFLLSLEEDETKIIVMLPQNDSSGSLLKPTENSSDDDQEQCYIPAAAVGSESISGIYERLKRLKPTRVASASTDDPSGQRNAENSEIENKIQSVFGQIRERWGQSQPSTPPTSSNGFSISSGSTNASRSSDRTVSHISFSSGSYKGTPRSSEQRVTYTCKKLKENLQRST